MFLLIEPLSFIKEISMAKGIGGIPYINLDPYLDIEGFKKLHYEMCYGITKSSKKEGNICKPGGIGDYQVLPKPLFQAIEDYYALSDDHEIKKYGKAIGELSNRDEFVQYLKLSLGAYDPYKFIFIKSESGGWETRFDEKPWTDDAQYFPGLVNWLNSLTDTTGQNVFEYLGRVIFMLSEHDVTMPRHRDIILPEENYTDHRHEYIHIRSNIDKGFYIADGPHTKDEDLHWVDCHACFFNDQDWHGGRHSNKQSFSLRIDGKFTDKFRKKIGIDHLEYY
jgi:hypothetical protein